MRPAAQRVPWNRAVLLLALIACSSVFSAKIIVAQEKAREAIRVVEISYTVSSASNVYLVWGVDNWRQVEKERWPEKTFVKNKVLYTPMRKGDDTYTTSLRLPIASPLQYGFLIEKAAPRSDYDRFIWDGSYESRKTAIKQSASLVHLENARLYRFIMSVLLAAVSVILLVLLMTRLWKHEANLKHAAKLAAANVLPVAIVLIAVESYLHGQDTQAIKIEPPAPYTFAPDPKKGIVPHPVLGWVTDPSKPGVNPQGFRDSKDFLEPATDDGKVRVMVLGDSFVWGVGVASPQTVTQQLQRELGTNYQVYNAGIAGFGISQMYATYQLFKDHIRPDIVVLAFIDNNVLRDLDGGKPAFTLEGDELVMRNRLTGRQRFSNAIAESSKLAALFVKEVDLAPFAYHVAGATLAALDRDVRRDGGQFLLFRIPVPDDAQYASSAWAKAFGLSALTEPGQLTLNDLQTDLAATPENVSQYYLNDAGRHLTNAGLGKLAALIGDRIRALKVEAGQGASQRPRQNTATKVNRSIAYDDAQPGEQIFLMWGVNGWQLPTADLLPKGSRIEDGFVLTPMSERNGEFTVELSLPAGTIVDYSFKAVDSNGKTLRYDINGGADYRVLFRVPS